MVVFELGCIYLQGKFFIENFKIYIGLIIYFISSDIDLVVIGCWPSPPLYKLEQKLLENEIAEQHTIKVLDKASVSTLKKFLSSYQMNDPLIFYYF